LKLVEDILAVGKRDVDSYGALEVFREALYFCTFSDRKA
jgi:hypothetical protein